MYTRVSLTVSEWSDFADVKIGGNLSKNQFRVYIIINVELKENSEKYFNLWLEEEYNKIFDLMVFSNLKDKDIAHYLGGLSIN